MNTSLTIVKRALMGIVLAVSVSTLSFAEDLNGTWRLVKRQLPEGTILTAPAVFGMSTVNNGIRHTNVFWQIADGRPASISVITEQKLTANKFTETLLAMAFDDGSGKPIFYNFSGETKSSPVKRQGATFSFKMPFDPPTVVSDGDTFTATLEGAFVDYWERVK